MTFYAPSRTVLGQLQRGLGRGARQATDPADVYACVRSDHRWWWAIDERAVYLARLIRDLDLSVSPLIERVRMLDTEDDDNEFTNTLEVLEVLGQAGNDEAMAEVRRHRDDPRPPAPRRPVPPDPYAHQPDEALLRILRDPGRSAEHRAVLRQFGRRPPVPELLDVVDGLTVGHLQDALAPLGPAVLPAARRWARARGRWCWDGWQFVAAHGDESDVPLLFDGLAWLRERADPCGHDVLVTGLARIGVPEPAELTALLRRLWLSPHSYERAAYLEAYLKVDREDAEPGLREGLWDCERDVRLLAVQMVGLDRYSRDRVAYLRDDPMEDPGVRGAAVARLIA